MAEISHEADQRSPQVICLKELCFRAVTKHFAALSINAVLDLPAPLIKDLLPYLTVCQLDELQPELNHRGISTHPGWIRVLQELYGPNCAIDLHTEEEAKHEVMRMLFKLIFYGYTNPFIERNIKNLNTPSFLWAAAKCIKRFFLIASSSQPFESLTAEQRPLLTLLENHIKSVGISQCINFPTQHTLYVLHRLLDHGVSKEVILNVQCPITLAWILHGRGSQYVHPELNKIMHSKKAGCISQAAAASADGTSCSPCHETSPSEDQDDQFIPCKRSKLDSMFLENKSSKGHLTVDPQVLCRTFNSSNCPPTGVCPWGQIHCLEIRECLSDSLRVLNAALPTFFCLRSLTLHSFSTFRELDVLGLAKALKLLYESSHSSLSHLSISVLPYTKLMEILLDASPKVTSLYVEIQSVMWGAAHHPTTAKSDLPAELPLEKLTVKVAEIQTDLHFITSVLRCSPHLTSLHVAGMRLPSGSSQSQLLSTLSASNLCLRSLNLEDMNLSDCLPEILHLLSNLQLEELLLNDCRLLERWNDKEENLKQLVATLKTVSSLHTLSLAQNRLAKNVCVLTQLFSGSSPSSLKRLDISSNFIQPAELLEFAEKLMTHHPQHRLILDLRKNPGDRDPNTWKTALKKLHPFCLVLFEGWKSTDTMVDHVSNM
ncbi:Leucine-rich repeat-containing protein 41 [Channa argus]|uniref:Leucine-rich repeat-containing protein 41 n=1 Tax=Channa argus TaxID=215402 RepID=A0A6G1PMK0_CHAAH|nr:Leucine-rich repeat-containing protein 41 [Channa argus]KAK2908392.1 hypothetical protein Q8A73_009465 [Channa argus]